MLKKQYMLYIIMISIFSSSLFGLTLKQSVISVLNNNPIVKERLRNYRATQQDLNIAESEYYPKLDFRATAGYNSAGKLYDHVRNIDYTNYTTTLTLTQNIFNGFGTMYKVDYQEARILAAAYHYIEKSNDISFKMVNAYINVLSSHELLNVAKENIKIIDDIYKNVQDLYKAGLTTESEVKKIQSALALSHTNYTVQQNNTRDKDYNFRRILGRLPDFSKMSKPGFNISLPKSLESAASYAITHNPSLLVARYDIKGAEALRKQKKKNYFPKIDLEVSQRYNDAHIDTNGFDQPDDRFTARIVFNYNFYNGGADKAEIQKNTSKVNQEVEIKRDLQRQVIEGMDLSWDACIMINKQLKSLKDYYKYSKQTLKLYQQEYDLGRRTLLDLLSAQNDLISSKKQIITAKYQLLFAKYRILDAMGSMVSEILGDNSKLTSAVNLQTNEKAHQKLDILPVKLDMDFDNITDNSDLCNNSLKQNHIMSYGCFNGSIFKKIVRFDALLFKNGKLKDTNASHINKIIKTIKENIKNGEDISISVIGHTDEPTDFMNEKTVKSNTYATKLEDLFRYKLSTGASFEKSRRYAVDIEKRLENAGIDKKLIIVKNEGGFNKAYTDGTKLGRELSNRVMVTLYVKKPIIGDSDKDGVLDDIDICPNTPSGVKVDKRGCAVDSDKDGIADYLDKCKETPSGVKVDKKGCAIDSDKDGVADYQDKCTQTPVGFKVDIKGCPIVKNLSLNFKTKSAKLYKNSHKQVVDFANFLKLYPAYNVKIIGYTDNVGTDSRNLKLSKRRAETVKKALEEEGISPSRLEAIGKGSLNPIADNKTKEGRRLNRRIEVKLLLR